MKKLYYNPMEVPERIHILSRAFGIDVVYDITNAEGKPVYLDDLFEVAKSSVFEAVEVFLTEHNEAYYRESRHVYVREALAGWVNLREYKKGGGYLQDRYN